MRPQRTPPTRVIIACAWLLLGAAAAHLAQAATSVEAPPGPAGGGGSSVVEAALPIGPPRRSRPVFVCHEGNSVTFADRPCDPVSEHRVVEWSAATGDGAVPRTVAPAPKASTRPRLVDDHAPARLAIQVQRCHELRRQLETIDGRMRDGYSAREAARLWSQWRRAKERLRESGC
jgi:hypothetical protein